MHPEATDSAEIERLFAGLEQRLAEDPDRLRREIEAELIAKYGRAWFDASRHHIDADWERAVRLLG